MTNSFKDKLIEVLINGKLIKQKDLDDAMETHKRTGGTLGKILVEHGAISQKTLMVIMSQHLNIPVIDLSKYKVAKEIISLIPEKISRQYLLLPISKIVNMVTVAMLDPLNLFAVSIIPVLVD